MSFVINRLFDEGNYDLILQAIFANLDGFSFECAALVCQRWRRICLRVLDRRSISWAQDLPQTRRFQLPGDRTLAITSREGQLLIGYESGDLELRNLHDNRLLHGPLTGHANLIRSVDLGTKYLISGSWDGSVRIWDKHTGDPLFQSCHHQGPVSGVKLTGDESKVLTCSRDTTVRMISLAKNNFKTIKETDFLLKHQDCVIDMSLDGSKLLTGCSDATLVLWNIDSQYKIATLKGHENGIRCCYLKDKLAVSGSKDHQMILWDVEALEAIRTFPHLADVRAVAFNSEVIVSSDECCDIFVWSLAAAMNKEESAEKLLVQTITGHTGFVHSIKLSPVGMVTCDIRGLLFYRDYFNSIQESPGRIISKCPDGVNCMSCNDFFIICGLINKNIIVFDRQEPKKVIVTLRGHSDHVWSLDQDRKFLVSGSWDGTVRVWNKSDWTLNSTINDPSNSEIISVKLNGNCLYFGSLGGNIIVMKLDDDSQRFHHTMIIQLPHEGGVYALDIKDSFFLSSHCRLKSVLNGWSVEAGSGNLMPKSKWTGQADDSRSVIWQLHLDPPLALVCYDNDKLELFNIDSLQSIRILKHQSKVLDAKIHRGMILAGCQFGLLVIWDLSMVLEAQEEALEMEKAFKIFKEHNGAIASIAIDDHELITVDYDGIMIARKLEKLPELTKLIVDDGQ